MGPMGYTLFTWHHTLKQKQNLLVINFNYKFIKNKKKTCTYRPSLSLKNKISRNKVDTAEAVPVQ